MKRFKEFVNEAETGEVQLYHGARSSMEEDKKKSLMFFTTSKRYAKLWGRKLYLVTVDIPKVFDATELGHKEINYKQLKKYLLSKGVRKDADYFYYLDKQFAYEVPDHPARSVLPGPEAVLLLRAVRRHQDEGARVH